MAFRISITVKLFQSRENDTRESQALKLSEQLLQNIEIIGHSVTLRYSQIHSEIYCISNVSLIYKKNSSNFKMTAAAKNVSSLESIWKNSGAKKRWHTRKFVKMQSDISSRFPQHIFANKDFPACFLSRTSNETDWTVKMT